MVRKRTECGTTEGYNRHRYRKEPYCAACKEAYNATKRKSDWPGAVCPRCGARFNRTYPAQRYCPDCAATTRKRRLQAGIGMTCLVCGAPITDHSLFGECYVRAKGWSLGL